MGVPHNPPGLFFLKKEWLKRVGTGHSMPKLKRQGNKTISLIERQFKTLTSKKRGRSTEGRHNRSARNPRRKGIHTPYETTNKKKKRKQSLSGLLNRGKMVHLPSQEEPDRQRSLIQ